MINLATAQERVWSTQELLREMSAPLLERRVRRGEFVRILHGWYADARDWAELTNDERHLCRTAGVVASLRGGDAVVSHLSAALVWGLPVVRVEPRAVHLTDARSRAGASAGVARHQLELEEVDRARVSNIAVTSVARTVMDVARVAPRECAIAVADAALARVSWDARRRVYDAAVADAWKADLLNRLALRGPGFRRASAVIAFADGRAESPGESISRLYLSDLGFRSVRPQVEIATHGRSVFADFAIDDADVWGEFDGRAKYLDEDVRAGMSAREAVDHEKEREDWIRAHSARRVVRWQWEHLRDSRTLGAYLAARNVRPSRA